MVSMKGAILHAGPSILSGPGLISTTVIAILALSLGCGLCDAAETPKDPPERAGKDWWSLQALKNPAVPKVRKSDRVRNLIDAFVLERLEAKGLGLSPPADPRTLVRRLYFTLIGLPPDPQVIEDFAQNPSEKAYRALVRDLLDSPHYGERWARHWLDVARYAESQGFERDLMRPNAWRYRDWVVHALNEDMPYDEFARLQIAGDWIHPGDPKGIIPTGFLVAAGWDEVGHFQQSLKMRAVVRADEMEDIVGTVCQTFLGLTVHCARCHDHKFDPISQKEYFQIASALSGVTHGERDITPPAVVETATRLKREIETQLDELTAEVRSIDQKVRREIAEERQADRLAGANATDTSVPTPLMRWEFFNSLTDSTKTVHGELHGDARLEPNGLVIDGVTGYVTTSPITTGTEGRAIDEKTLTAWVTIKDPNDIGGGVIALENPDEGIVDALVYGWARKRRWAGVGHTNERIATFAGVEEPAKNPERVHVALVYSRDGTVTCYRNGEQYGVPFRNKSLLTFEAGQTRLLFGVRQTPANHNRILEGLIHQASVYDRALAPEEVAAAAADFLIDEDMIIARLNVAQQARRVALRAQIDKLAAIDTTFDRVATYCAVALEPKEPTQIQERGNPATLGEVVAPGGMACVSGVSPAFGLPPDGPEGPRRVKLAEWITDKSNVLFSRTIVNRIWHYHFGAGIVPSPSDLGYSGGHPSHPELIDYLAARLIESDWSLKTLHELLVTSSTWRQSSRHRERPAAVDTNNRLLWRKSRTRLEAEALRDSILLVSGQLNTQVGGPSFRDFETYTHNSQFYEIIDAVGPEFNRRTLYRMGLRGCRHPLLDAFDCPDPSVTAPRRAVTTTPSQSLSLMNNSFALRMADHFADRVSGEVGAELPAQINRVFALAYGRRASDDEIESGRQFVEAHGLPAFCRVVLNSNEFLYVD